MKLLRSILGLFILWYERMFAPEGLKRPPEVQRKIEQELKSLCIYEFETCPFCVKVRFAMKRLSLPIERRNILKNKSYEDELLKGGGERQVPCLRIEEAGKVRWLYESSDIISYLEARFQ